MSPSPLPSEPPINPVLLQLEVVGRLEINLAVSLGVFSSIPISGPNDNSNPYLVPFNHSNANLFMANKDVLIPSKGTPSPPCIDNTLLLDMETWPLWFANIYKSSCLGNGAWHLYTSHYWKDVMISSKAKRRLYFWPKVLRWCHAGFIVEGKLCHMHT